MEETSEGIANTAALIGGRGEQVTVQGMLDSVSERRRGNQGSIRLSVLNLWRRSTSQRLGVSIEVELTYNWIAGGRCRQPEPISPSLTEHPIATKRNTYAKRAREQEKKRRAEDKRAKREVRKDAPKPEFDVEGGAMQDEPTTGPVGPAS